MELRLKDLMKAKGMTSVRIAELVGMHKTNVSNIINGKQMPSVETLERFADVLDVCFTDLFVIERTETPPPSPAFTCPHCGKPIEVVVQKKEKELE